VAQRVVDAVERRIYFEQFGLVARALAEIGTNSGCKRAAMVQQHLAQAPQSVGPHRPRGWSESAGRVALGSENNRQCGFVGGHT
jgi:hypothetical protein